MTAHHSRARSLIACLVALASLVAACGDDDDDDAASTTQASTTVADGTTTSPTSTSPDAEPVDTSTAVWPPPSSGDGLDSPEEAARSFAVELVGMTDPVLGEFQAGDSRSGEVDVRAIPNGPVTTVFVRQLGPGGGWWVLGSATADIEVDVPAAGQSVSSPMRTTGRARAFEGTVIVEIYADGVNDPVGEGFVTGRGDGVLGPFDGEITFDAGDAEFGAAVYTTESAENGARLQASVVRITFES